MTKQSRKFLYVFMMFTSANAFIHADNHNNGAVQVDIFNDLAMTSKDDPDSYDKFDQAADDMVDRHMPLESPKPVSDFQYVIRKLGSPFLLKYLAIKQWMKNLFAKKSAQNKTPLGN